jgi:hypothetical protein
MSSAKWRCVSSNIHKVISVQDKNQWLQLRNELGSFVSGSRMPIYYGYGYQSLNKFLANKNNIEDTPFAKKYKDYGNLMEPEAKSYFMDVNDYILISNGEETIHKILEYTNGEDDDTIKINILLTPDCIVCEKIPDYKNIVIEFKCPLRVIEMGERIKKPLSYIMEEYRSKNRNGVPYAFIQALFYSIFMGRNDFATVHYFKGINRNRGMMVYNYHINDDMLQDIKTMLLEDVRLFNDMILGEEKKIRVDSKKKEWVCDIMRLLHTFTKILPSINLGE